MYMQDNTCMYPLSLSLSLSPHTLSAITDQLAEKYHLPIKSAFNNARGFYLQLYTGETASRRGKGRQKSRPAAVGMTAEQLPKEFIKISRHRTMLSFTTMDLIKLNS